MCGFRLSFVDNFAWYDEGNELIENDLNVYNYIPEDSSLLHVQHGIYEDYHLYGLDITGPIGACDGEDSPWHFSFPLTKTSELSPVNGSVKLVINTAGVELEFLNYAIEPGEFLKLPDLYQEDTFERSSSYLETQSLMNFLHHCEIFVSKTQMHVKLTKSLNNRL